MKLSKGLIDKLLSLVQGETIPSSRLKGEWVDEMLREGVLLSISRRSRIVYQATDGNALRTYLANHYESLRDLEAVQAQMQSDQTTILRADQVAVSGNSKLLPCRTFSGFLVNAYDPIPARIAETELIIHPQEGIFLFIADYTAFTLPPDILIIGIENSENFRYIHKLRYLFGEERILFVSRYPQSKDLVRWLSSVPNRYLHFGDLDLAGIHIYLSEFYAHLKSRASFFIPEDAEKRIQIGSRERYDVQLSRFDKMKITDSRVSQLVSWIHIYHRGYDQEGYISSQSTE